MTRQEATDNMIMPEGEDRPIVTTGAPSLAGPIDAMATPPRPPSNAKPLLIGMVGAGLMICAVGLIVNLTRDPNKASAAPASSYFSEQQKTMRDAVQMAREAQEMQKERLRLMQEEMRNAEQNGGKLRRQAKDDPSAMD